MRQNITSGIQEGNFSGQKIQSLITLFETQPLSNWLWKYFAIFDFVCAFFYFLACIGVCICLYTYTFFSLCIWKKVSTNSYCHMVLVWVNFWSQQDVFIFYLYLYYTFIFLILFWQDNETHFYRVLRNESSFKGGAWI